MERRERLINIWNGEFPNYPLTAGDLKKPHAMIGAFFQLFNRIGIDIDALVSPPPEEERDAHTIYYWDLLPIINMTRVINHIIIVLKQADKLSINFPLTISYFLAPDDTTSHAILLMLVNLMAFNEDRLRQIAPLEEELFGKRDQVKALEDRKNKMLQMLNDQAEEKAKRADRLAKVDHDINQFEEELKLEKEAYNEEKQELDRVLNENRQHDLLLEQKKGHRDALLAEAARKSAQRVYDAEVIKAQAEQAAQNVQEAEEKLNSLNATLMQKENSLMNLQKIKPNLDQANNLMHEVMKLSENLKDLETGDLDCDSAEGELLVLHTEISDLQMQLAELQAAREELDQRRDDHLARRQHQKTQLESALKEAEEKDKKSLECMKRSQQTIEEIKERTTCYLEDKNQALEELEDIKRQFCADVVTYEEMLLKTTTMAQEKIQKRLCNRRDK